MTTKKEAVPDRERVMRAAKRRTVYSLADGTRIPSVTTVTALLNRPYLVAWANRLGLDGVDSGRYSEETAAAGTLAHTMIEAALMNTQPDCSGYSALQIDLAENSLLSFYEWLGRHSVEVLLLETPMVSEKLRYGGTPDCYCLLDGEPTLLDFKTGKAVYDENFLQLAAYRGLLEERGLSVRQCAILRAGRDESEGFELRYVPDTARYFQIFKNLLDIYRLKKELKWK